MKKSFEYYRGLPYVRRCQLMVDDGTSYWHAWIEELPGCEVDGSSKADAYASLDEVFEDYIASKIEWRSVIPEPTRWPNYGKKAKGFQKAMAIVPPAIPKGRVENVQESDSKQEEMTAVAG